MIDLDAAMGSGSNDDLVELLASQRGVPRRRRRAHRRARARRWSSRARTESSSAPRRFTQTASTRASWRHRDAVGRERLIIALDSKDGRIVVKGWQEVDRPHRRRSAAAARALLLGLPLHLRRQGRHDAGHRPRLVPPPARRDRRSKSPPPAASPRSTKSARCSRMNIHAALGMAIYTGRLDLAELAALSQAVLPVGSPFMHNGQARCVSYLSSMRKLALLALCRHCAAADDAQFNGRWDITVPHESRARAWWLEVTRRRNAALKGRFVGFPGGDMNDIPHLAIQNGELRFSFDYTGPRSGKPMHLDYSARFAATVSCSGPGAHPTART